MHEMGIVSGILEASLGVADREGATRVNEIHVRVGEFSEVVEDALQFAFEALSAGTLAEGGKLIVEHVPATSRCMQCDVEFPHGRFDAVCPECESFLCEILTGRELEVSHIDIELPEDSEDQS